MTRSFLCLLTLALFLAPAATAAPSTLAGTVSRVYDGDTIRVEPVGKVRMLGIDAPEREESERDDHYLRQGIDRERLRAVAREARQFTAAEARGKTVRLETDHQSRDRHGRLLAYVYLPDGRLLNGMLLDEGLAAVYRRFDFRLKDDFLRREESARARGAGLWQRQAP